MSMGGVCVCVCLCVCVCELFTGLMDLQGLIFPISVSHAQRQITCF